MNSYYGCFSPEIKGTWWYHKSYTTVLVGFLHKGTLLIDLWLMTAAYQLVQVVGGEKGGNIQKEKSPRPQEGAPHAPIPRVKSERGSTQFFRSSLHLPLPRSFSWSYHAVGSFRSLRGASSFPSHCRCLLFLHRLQDTMMMRRMTTKVMPPPMANARRRSSEKEAVVTTRRRISPIAPWTSGGFFTWHV